MDQPFYEFDSVRYPRVTRILSILKDPDLEKWEDRVGPSQASKVLKSSIRVGNKLDKAIKDQLRGLKGHPSGSSEVIQGWKAWSEYYSLNQLDYQVGEPMVSKTYHYAGEPDLYLPNTKEVIEIKATTAIRDKHWIQLHSYVPLIWKASGVWSDVTLRVVRLDTFLGTFEEKTMKFDPAIWEGFMHLKEVYMAWFAKEMQDGE